MNTNIKKVLKYLDVQHIDLDFKQWTPDEIFDYRCKYCLTQSQLAALLGVTKLHINLLENDKRLPSATLRLCLTLWDFYMQRKKRNLYEDIET
jgi:DNA-binding XRE family transcriptional regulator